MLSKPLDSARNVIRRYMQLVARALNRLSAGHLTPDMVTYTSLIGHIPIAYLIATERFLPAALLLIVFGLMDTLDGELARLQNRASAGGMLLDATTDRMKEVLLYSGAAYVLVWLGQPIHVAVAVLACGGSLLVSYVKAKGETALSDSSMSVQQKNRYFQDGLLRYEVRMAVLVIGLAINQLAWAIIVIAVLSWLTAFQRLFIIRQKL